MAKITVHLTAEVDLINDALADLERAFRALATCHGSRFRDLERRIEQLAAGKTQMSPPTPHWLGGGIVVFEAPLELKALLRDARNLGVLR